MDKCNVQNEELRYLKTGKWRHVSGSCCYSAARYARATPASDIGRLLIRLSTLSTPSNKNMSKFWFLLQIQTRHGHLSPSTTEGVQDQSSWDPASGITHFIKLYDWVLSGRKPFDRYGLSRAVQYLSAKASRDLWIVDRMITPILGSDSTRKLPIWTPSCAVGYPFWPEIARGNVKASYSLMRLASRFI